MKFQKILFYFIILAVTASCSNSIGDEPGKPGVPAINIAKKPDFVIWSGTETLGDSREDKTEGSIHDNNHYESGEVEINLALMDGKQAGDLIGKLSIHVRCATTVDVRIPVPQEYYCDQDDLYYYNKSPEDFPSGNSIPLSQTTYEMHYDFDIEGTKQRINMQLTYVTLERDTEGQVGYIRAQTGDISPQMMEWCRTKGGDGFNFEIYLYFNKSRTSDAHGFTAWTFSSLKEKLDGSEVTFGSPQNVRTYINSITMTENPVRDCTVDPTQKDNFPSFYLGNRQNGSTRNRIFPNAL